MEVIEIKDLTFSYLNRTEKVLDNINIKINEGEFVLLIGESGCGKSTLLRHLKNEISPYGRLSGEILYKGKNIKDIRQRESVSEIGFVMQNPDYQIVTDKVWHELAFGLENLGVDSQTIRRRVAEIASFFGIQSWFRKDVSELSGGQKQLLSLASIMVMQPKVLVLDEPTSQLDPIAAIEFLDILHKINSELGVTVILTEHRLEEVFSMSDKVILMESGRVKGIKSPREIGDLLYNDGKKEPMFYSLPTPIRAYKECEGKNEAPLTIKEGASWINKSFNLDNAEFKEEKKENSIGKDTVIELRNICFRYDRKAQDILRDLNLKVYKNEIVCILGGNGTGKSTTLGVISGNNKPYRGKAYINNKRLEKYSIEELFNNNLAVLPQDPQSLFVRNTLLEELEETFDGMKISEYKIKEKVESISKLLKIHCLLESHPYDLSGGEQQKAALGKLLLLDPKILILDEPTKGLDGSFKRELIKIFRKLRKSGKTIVIVTHDIEFAAEIADRCIMFFDGDVVSEGEPREFFCENSFYTTYANKMTRGRLKNILKVEDIIDVWKIQKQEN